MQVAGIKSEVEGSLVTLDVRLVWVGSKLQSRRHLPASLVVRNSHPVAGVPCAERRGQPGMIPTTVSGSTLFSAAADPAPWAVRRPPCTAHSGPTSAQVDVPRTPYFCLTKHPNKP